MNLKIKCAYCGQAMTLKFGDTEATFRTNKIGPPFSCGTCGSTTQLVISTKRVRQGKKYKALVEAANARLLVAIDARREENRIAGDKLLAEPGCTCAALLAKWGESRGSSTYYERDGGHPLSTGWSRDDKLGGLLPTAPHHFHQCALRKAA